MKIVLFTLNASGSHSALGVRCLRAALRRAGREAAVLEYTVKEPRRTVLDALMSAHADVYGFSLYIWNLQEMLSYAQALKAVCPTCRIVFGGPEVSYEDAAFFVRAPFVDALIRGEGECALPQLCKSFEDGTFRAGTVIDGTPDPAFPTAGMMYDPGEQAELFYYESTRGCPYHCAFCLSGDSAAVRAKSVPVVLSELRALTQDGRSCRVVKFVDRTFNFDRARAKEILRALADPVYSATYHFEIGADLLDDETVEILSALPPGKVLIEAGVQSLNPETLEAIHRVQDPQTVLHRIAQIRAAKTVHVHADLIAGLPFETEASFARAVDAVYPCADVVQLGFLKLLRGSELRQKAEIYGIRFEQYPPYTVLSTPTMPYEAISRLHALDDVLQRFGGAAFSETRRVLGGPASPYRFFSGLAAHLENGGMPVRRFSQRAAFTEMFAYARAFCTDACTEPLLRSAIALDFLRSETGPLPAALGPAETADDAEAHAAWLAAAKAAGVRPPCLAVLRPRCRGGSVTVIDRQRHIELAPTAADAAGLIQTEIVRGENDEN